jgi:hypothetical protein
MGRKKDFNAKFNLTTLVIVIRINRPHSDVERIASKDRIASSGVYMSASGIKRTSCTGSWMRARNAPFCDGQHSAHSRFI